MIRRERDVLALASYRKGIPPVSVASYASRVDESHVFFGQVTARADVTHVPTVRKVEPVASPVDAWISWHPGAQRPRTARSMDVQQAQVT